ncbi:MAG: hypothetical protein LBH37_02820 [Oscillospiraceae bacterium]|jgi:hypothetical protein|nr:hypothetical protein [Oscillospiraceae bacterium]
MKFKLKNFLNNWFVVSYSLQVILGISFFTIGYLGSFDNLLEDQNFDADKLILSSRYFEFISSDSTQTALKLSLNNFILSLFFYILSIFTLSLSGLLFLPGSGFILGSALRQNQNFLPCVFIFLETIGVLSTCFLGTYLPYSKVKRNLSTKKMLIISFLFIIALCLLYSLAGIIESNLIFGRLQ